MVCLAPGDTGHWPSTVDVVRPPPPDLAWHLALFASAMIVWIECDGPRVHWRRPARVADRAHHHRPRHVHHGHSHCHSIRHHHYCPVWVADGGGGYAGGPLDESGGTGGIYSTGGISSYNSGGLFSNVWGDLGGFHVYGTTVGSTVYTPIIQFVPDSPCPTHSTPVPEPSTWFMMILGFVVIALSWRKNVRRYRSAA